MPWSRFPFFHFLASSKRSHQSRKNSMIGNFHSMGGGELKWCNFKLIMIKIIQFPQKYEENVQKFVFISCKKDGGMVKAVNGNSHSFDLFLDWWPPWQPHFVKHSIACWRCSGLYSSGQSSSWGQQPLANGLRQWFTQMVYANGLHQWFTPMVYANGLR